MMLSNTCHLGYLRNFGYCFTVRAHFPDGFFNIHTAQTKHLLQPVGYTAGQIAEAVKDFPDNTPALVFIQLLPVQLPFIQNRRIPKKEFGLL